MMQGFAVLPQQSEKEIEWSEWHSRLDRVLSFLLRDVGYSLLGDARPVRGGGVRLQNKAPFGQPPWRADHKSMRIPRGDTWLDAEEAEAIRIGPTAAKYAQYPEDLVLVWRFAALLAEASPAAADKVKHDTFYKTVLQGVRLMHLCDFHYSDVVVTLAYASSYFQSTFAAIGHIMSNLEAAHVCTLLIFLAHSFVLDETCPLRCWQRHVFRRYCTLKVLDAALFRLFNLRGFHLQLTKEEERFALAALLCSSTGLHGGSDVGDVPVAAVGLNGFGGDHVSGSIKDVGPAPCAAGKCAGDGACMCACPADRCTCNGQASSPCKTKASKTHVTHAG